MWGNVDMVWLFSFLAVTNIAMGYGLAVYVTRHFGTPLVGPPSIRSAKRAAPVAAQLPAAAESMPIVSPAAIEDMIESEIAADADPEPTEIGGASPADVAATESVDEENVLAGIEEFRSQLAKINASSTDANEETKEEVESELVGAAN